MLDNGFYGGERVFFSWFNWAELLDDDLFELVKCVAINDGQLHVAAGVMLCVKCLDAFGVDVFEGVKVSCAKLFEGMTGCIA